MRLLREPLLHFAVLGIGLFALYHVLSGGPPAVPDEIVVDGARIAALAEQFERTWQRAPTTAEVDGLVEGYVRDEVLYREGLALGLDRDDPVIRSRVRLKMEVISDGPDAEVAEADLQEWLDANADRYASPARYDLRQVFFAPSRHGTALDAAMTAALQTLERDDRGWTEIGDPTLLPPSVSGSAGDLAAQFGDGFAAALADVSLGRWLGPVESAYGQHLVRIDAREDGARATLEQVRAEIERDVRYARAAKASDELYARLRARYRVRVEAQGASLDGALASEP